MKILRERINIDLINKNNSIGVDPKTVIVVKEVKKIIKIQALYRAIKARRSYQ